MRLSISTTVLTAAFVFLPAVFAQATPQNSTAAAQPGANLPMQPVGPNDLISLYVYDSPEFSRTIRIGADGFLRLPMMKQRVKVQGLLPAEIESAIAAALKEEELLVDPFVTVTIAEYHNRPISVNGAVKVPLVFQADGPVTLLEALARAQGLRDDAGSEILVSQSQAGPDDKPMTLTRRIPVRSLIDDADASFNVRLSGGEEIRVPEVGRIYVVGNVKKPGSFSVKSSGDTTVLQMIALAEGLAPYYTKQAYIYRQEGAGGKNEIPVSLDKIMARKAPDVPLMADDILYIPDNKGRRLTLGALEKLVGISTAMGTTALYVLR